MPPEIGLAGKFLQNKSSQIFRQNNGGIDSGPFAVNLSGGIAGNVQDNFIGRQLSIAGLEKVDAFKPQGIIDDDIFLLDHLPLFKDGQSRAKFFGGTGIIKRDIEIIAPDLKTQRLPLIAIVELNRLGAFSLCNVDKAFKTKNGSDQSTD